MKPPLRIVISLVFVALAGFTQSAWGTRPTAVLVGLAGRDSCQGVGPHQTVHARRVKQLIPLLKDVGYTEVDSLYVCFDRYDYLQGGIRFNSSLAANLIYTGYLQHVEATLDSLTREKEVDVFIVGYSYGGWLAMRLVQRVALSHAETHLFSIDPISAKFCGPSEVIFGGNGCKQAPQDLSAKSIVSKTRSWTNFFQTESDWIHSSAISGAKNYRLYTGHTSIDDAASVWNSIRARITSGL